MSFQDLVFLLNGYPVLKAGKDINQIRLLKGKDFVDYQQKAKWEIVQHHFTNNPFYRGKVGSEIPTQWSDLPVLEKMDFQLPLQDILANGYEVSKIYTSKTSGSSGHPMYFGRDNYSHARNWSVVIDRYRNLGMPVGAKIIWFYGLVKELLPRLKERLKDWLMNRNRFVVFDLSESALNQLMQRFSRKKYVGIYGYTHSVVHFAKYLRDKNIILKDICPSLKSIIVTSELCTLDDRKIMESSFGVKVYSEYGASEFGYIGFDNGHDTWQLSEENLFVEVLPVDGLPVETYGGKVVVTDLTNKAFPFIRFSIGDLASLKPDPENPGRQILTRLMGRTNDMATLKSGRIVPGLVFYYVSKSIIEKAKGIRQYVVRQTSISSFEFVLEATEKLSESIEDTIRQDIAEYLEPGLSVTFIYVDSIAKSTNGKIKHFYSDFKA